MDYARYNEMKKEGGITLQKIGANAVVFIRKFNPNTGAEQNPEMGSVSVQEILKVREDQAKILAGIDEFLADVKALGVNTDPANKTS